MAKKLFNEAETYLLENWTDARLLEKALEAMRGKYKEICGKVLNDVTRKHPQLECRGWDLEQDEEDDEVCDCISLGLGKKAWPSRSRRNYPSGLWMGGIGLGELITRKEGFPYACVWINPDDSKLDLTDIAKTLEEAARRLLPDLETETIVDDEDNAVSIEYPLPESRGKLLELLLHDESRGFIDCLVAHFEPLTKFIAVIDGLLRVAKKNGT